MDSFNDSFNQDDDIIIEKFGCCNENIAAEPSASSRVSTNSTLNIHKNKGISMQADNNHLRLTYNGLLAKSGAQEVYAVIGLGSNKNWEDVKYYHMSNSGSQTFDLLLPTDDTRNINVAFKDGADHWDNNSGRNYSFNSH